MWIGRFLKFGELNPKAEIQFSRTEGKSLALALPAFLSPDYDLTA